MPRLETSLVHAGRDPDQQNGFVNPPIYRGSTVIYEDVQALNEMMSDPLKTSGRVYARFGTPASRALEAAMTELEGGHAAVCTNSGLSAITTAILALVRAGDHLLVTDSAYFPTRAFCQSLERFGIQTEFYDPAIGAGIESLLRPETRLVFLESPGSLTFEVQDVPAICQVCRSRKVTTLIDNTWATPIFLRPLQLGADLSIHSATKYITGHSDSYLGVIVCNEATYPSIRQEALRLGQCASPEDVHLGLRGLRTLAVRLRHHQSQAIELARWLASRPEVSEVLHPALPGFAGHPLWKRDFRGAAGVFSIVLRSGLDPARIEAMLDGFELFRLGHSFGGYESLALPVKPAEFRITGNWQDRGPVIRLQIGMESVEDLRADLARGLDSLHKG